MAFGKHWEWRGFGRLPKELRASIERLPRKFPDSQHVTDSYLFVPGCSINIKLREGYLKFKRLLEKCAGLECWLEDPDENHPFPITPSLVVKIASELGITIEEPARDVATPGALAELFEGQSAGVQIIAVEKERWQYDWAELTSESLEETAEPVIVELAEIISPESILSLGLEHPDAAPVAGCRDALGVTAHLKAASYLDALSVWAQGRRVD